MLLVQYILPTQSSQILTLWLNPSFKAWEKITTQCVWQKPDKSTQTCFYFSCNRRFHFWHCSKCGDSQSALHIFVCFFSEPGLLLQQWASFMLLYGLYTVLYKYIYLALGETASSCFILTWTLNLSLYIVRIRRTIWLTVSPSGSFVMKNMRLASFLSTAVSLYCCQRSPSVSPVWDGLWPQWKSNRG